MDNIFAATDYNGDVRIWDIRAEIPISTTELHTGKALCGKWLSNEENKIITGGSDCCVRTLTLN